jgi:hypothetical protein
MHAAFVPSRDAKDEKLGEFGSWTQGLNVVPTHLLSPKENH